MVKRRSPKPLMWVRFLLPLPLFNWIFCFMAIVAKRLTHRIVAPAREGSNPSGRPIFILIILGYSQAVRQRVLVPSSPRFESWRSEEHTSELQSRFDLVCRLLLEK